LVAREGAGVFTSDFSEVSADLAARVFDGDFRAAVSALEGVVSSDF